MQSGVEEKVGLDYFCRFLWEIDRNFGMKFRSEAIFAGNSEDGGWIWIAFEGFRFCLATCGASVAAESELRIEISKLASFASSSNFFGKPN